MSPTTEIRCEGHEAAVQVVRDAVDAAQRKYAEATRYGIPTDAEARGQGLPDRPEQMRRRKRDAALVLDTLTDVLDRLTA